MYRLLNVVSRLGPTAVPRSAGETGQTDTLRHRGVPREQEKEQDRQCGVGGLSLLTEWNAQKSGYRGHPRVGQESRAPRQAVRRWSVRL